MTPARRASSWPPSDRAYQIPPSTSRRLPRILRAPSLERVTGEAAAPGTGNRRDRTGWLGMEDSNQQMSLPKLAFEVWPEFPFISERLAIKDFSRLSCQRVTCTPVQCLFCNEYGAPIAPPCGQAMLKRRLLWIREFESSHPSQAVRSLLFDFWPCENCRHSARQ
jgi:hypothetical protein